MAAISAYQAAYHKKIWRQAAGVAAGEGVGVI